MPTLDDLTYIHERDAQDTLGIVQRQHLQLEYDFKLPELGFTPQNIVYAAMGGSAAAAQLALPWVKCQVPFEIVRDYTLPDYVSEKTLVIVASYSGNSEETLSAMDEAVQKGAKIAVISGGGQMVARANSENYLLALMPPLSQSRFATFYNLKALLDILVAAGVVERQAVQRGLSAAKELLERESAKWSPELPTRQNPAKQLALELIGRSAVIYSGPKLASAAFKWKIDINENAKQVAWTNQLPEMNHNEFMGWTEQPIEKLYAVVDLRSHLDHPRVQKRFKLTEQLLSGRRPQPQIVEVQGQTWVEQILWSVAFGDIVSLYLALLNGIDPAPVDMVTKLKQAMEQ